MIDIHCCDYHSHDHIYLVMMIMIQLYNVMMMIMKITVRSYLLTLNTNTLLPITSLDINMVIGRGKIVPVFDDTQTFPIYVSQHF